MKEYSMKTTIYYMTGTGNCLSVAKTIDSNLGHSVDLIRVQHPLTQSATENNSQQIGFVFPCYCHTVPDYFTEFLKTLKIKSSNPYLFALVTHNGEPGNSLIKLNKLLKAKGQSLHYGRLLQMPGNSIVMENYMNPPGEQVKRLTHVKEIMPTICHEITTKTRFLDSTNNSIMDKLKGVEPFQSGFDIVNKNCFICLKLSFYYGSVHKIFKIV